MLSKLLGFCFLISTSMALAQHPFHEHFKLKKDQSGAVVAVQLKSVTSTFSIRPLLNKFKEDLLDWQKSWNKKSFMEQNESLMDVYDLLDESGLTETESKYVKDALTQLPQMPVESSFNSLEKSNFWTTFNQKLSKALDLTDLSIVAYLNDPRYFYKKKAITQVVQWGIKEAQKHFSQAPVLNIAIYTIQRVHELILDQRRYSQMMLLHYFDSASEAELGMTKVEVDKAMSSIFESTIALTDVFSSNAAAKDWLNFGWSKFYAQSRVANTKLRELSMSNRSASKLNFSFALVNDGGDKVYHLLHSAHQFSRKSSLAFDFNKPNRVKNLRQLLFLGGFALGFINIPGWIKSNVDGFMKSFYVGQVYQEGGLRAYYLQKGDLKMAKALRAQRINPYLN